MTGVTPLNTPSTKGSSSARATAALIDQVVDSVGKALIGKQEQVKLALCCLLARGHLLIEDMPGMGKTTLANALAIALGLSYQRVQFTSDMLPSDVLGSSVFNREQGTFEFVKGPVFSQLLLADEVNRTTPKTQSALLEAMEEGQVSVDGHTHELPQPFFVIATQNPSFQSGTYPLPESQLDRFLMKISIGYPTAEAERELLSQGYGGRRQEQASQVVTVEQLTQLQALVDKVNTREVLLDYLQRLVDYSRSAPEFSCGLSPRASLGILQAARAWALIHHRDHCLPEDIQAVLASAAAHRLSSNAASLSGGQALVAQMLDSVDVV